MPSRRRLLRRVSAAAAVSAVASGPAPVDGRTDTSAVRWQRTYGTGSYQFRSLVEDDDGVLVVGRTGSGRDAAPWVAAVGSDGEPRWTTTVEVPGFGDAVDAVRARDGYTVLGTTDGSPRMWLVHLDTDGRERWRRRAESPRGVRVLHATDDGYLVGGYRGNPRRVDADLTAWLRALDADGRMRWERIYDGSHVADVVRGRDGFVLAGGADGDAWLRSIDADGRPRWRHVYGGVGREDAAVAVPAGAGFLYGGATGSIEDVHRRGMLVRSTGDGAFVWRRTHEVLDVAALVPFGDGFAFTGEPPSGGRTGRNPDKPVSLVDRWGRVRATVTITRDPAEPGGLVRAGDGTVLVGGRDFDHGVWLARVEFEAGSRG